MVRKFQFVLALIFGLVAAGGASAATVVLGTDYFETSTGTMFDFGGSIGTVDFTGKEIGPGATDTIIERTTDVTIDGGAGNLLLTALSLESTAPVTIPGIGTVPIYITLNPADLSLDTGTITIMGSTAGGTFNSTLDVYFDVCLAPGPDGVGCAAGTSPILTDMVALSQSGASWLPTPLPGSEIVEGPVGDQAANLHTGLTSGQVDFFPGALSEMHAGTGVHDVVQAVVPEPSTWLMLLVGFGGLGAVAMARRRQSAVAAG